MPEQSCLFCRIIAGEIPADIIYQDEHCLVFRDVNPQSPVHALVIPRTHVKSLREASRIDSATLGHLLHVAARIADEQGLSESGYRAVINTGTGAGQSVFHLHIHVLGGRPLSWPPG